MESLCSVSVHPCDFIGFDFNMPGMCINHRKEPPPVGNTVRSI